jgi:PIN domain
LTLPAGCSGLTLDAGALIGWERRSVQVRALLDAAHRRGWPIAVPSGALAQVWRNGARQALLARLVSAPPVDIVSLDEHVARAAGELCGYAGHADVVDASVVLCARQRRHAAVTSDPTDLARFDPRLPLIVV